MGFQYISDIISKFTQKQRILVLFLLLFSITLIFLGPDLMNKFGGDVDILKSKLREKDNEIDSLNLKIITISRSMVDNEQNCTNRLLEREREIMAQLDTLEKTLNKQNNRIYQPQLSYIFESNGHVSEAQSVPIDINNNDFAINGIKKIKGQIKKHMETNTPR